MDTEPCTVTKDAVISSAMNAIMVVLYHKLKANNPSTGPNKQEDMKMLYTAYPLKYNKPQ